MGGCGATLVSSKHVITAAHCIHQETINQTINLGVHSVEYDDSQSVLASTTYKPTNLPHKGMRGLAKFIVHPEYKGNT